MSFFYVAHRLFAAHDRALGALLAERLGAVVGPDAVFLPFCDTNEEDLIAEVKGRRLFELDIERLQHLSGMIAVLHGPSLDDGVCMEIGYAAALTQPLRTAGWDVTTATRMHAADPLTAAATDWAALNHADLLVADVAGPETPPGAALMIGASVAAGRRILAYQPASSWTFAHGREPNWRNLMIQYASERFSQPTELDHLLAPRSPTH